MSIFEAAWEGNLQIVKEFIENGADVNAKDILGRTALYLASYFGNLEIVKYLESKGAVK